MDEFRNHINCERDRRATAEEIFATAFGRGVSQPENHQRVNEAQRFGSPSRGVDMLNLESSFGRLSVSDSRLLHPPEFPLAHNRRNNQSPSSPSLQNHIINVGGDRFTPQQYNPRTSYMNRNSRDAPYFLRTHFFDHSPWDSTNSSGSGINNDFNRYNPNDSFQSLDNSSGSNISLASSHGLQMNMAGGSKETIDALFNGVIHHIFDLMVDPYGNQVLKKMLEKCNSHQISQILHMITQNQFQFFTICSDPLGYTLLLW